VHQNRLVQSPAAALAGHLANEETFDTIASKSEKIPLHEIVESTLQTNFLAERVVFFYNVSSVQMLFSPTTALAVPYGSGLIGYTHFSKGTVVLAQESNCPAYNSQDTGNCPPNCHVLCFPLFDGSSNVRAVVGVVSYL
jgi:hypothetical protein